MSCNGVCSWPHELDPDCALHGRVIDCACGTNHDTMPLVDLGYQSREVHGVARQEEIFVMGVCREHRRHLPCRGCESESHRRAEAVLFGRPFRPPKDLHHGTTL